MPSEIKAINTALCETADQRKKNSIGSYLLLEYALRLFRNGKARINDGVRVLDRLGTSAEFWVHRIKKMLGSSELRGCFFACKADSISQTAEHRYTNGESFPAWRVQLAYAWQPLSLLNLMKPMDPDERLPAMFSRRHKATEMKTFHSHSSS